MQSRNRETAFLPVMRKREEDDYPKINNKTSSFGRET
jgi:hypothetical protein